jgi:hypothetical protein
MQCKKNASNINSCAPIDIIKSEINNIDTKNQLFFSYLYMQGIAKVSNLSDPIGTTLSNTYDALDFNVTKRKYQIYKKIKLDSDNGWLFSQIVTSTIYCLGKEISDFVLKDPETNNLLHRMTFYFRRSTDSYTRSYTKIQEIFAQIGGLSSMINILLLMIYEKMGLLFKYKKIMKKIRLANSQMIPNNPTHIKIKNYLQSEDISILEKKIESLDF